MGPSGSIRLFERATQFGMEAVAITDHGTMFNVLEFYQKAIAAGIKPVIGCEMLCGTPHDSRTRRPLMQRGCDTSSCLPKIRKGIAICAV
jgi:DNA polymerase-3 subunit alpha